MIGKTIFHYSIIEKLGEGGMGVVYKAEDLKLKRTVALKFLLGYHMSLPRFRARLEREAQAASSLTHPNICPVYAYHETEDSMFLVMEFIEGETLKQIIDRDGPFSQGKAIDIITQVAEALAVAHDNGVIHRDIKSDNIMITPDGQVKVMDFGLAKLKDAPTITKSGVPIGTVAYMSPELVQGKEVDHRTDLWSLGVVLFEMLTGVLPFDKDSDVATMYSIIGDTPPKLTKYNSEISNSIQYVITTLLEKESALRYQKAEEVLKDLKRSIRGSTTKLVIRKIRKNYKQISIAIILILIVSFFVNNYYQTQINIPPWLNKNAKLTRLTSEPGDVSGRISPDGRYLVFRSGTERFRLMDLSTKEVIKLFKNDTLIFGTVGTSILPVWSPDSKKIAYVSGFMNAISIIDINTKDWKFIT